MLIKIHKYAITVLPIVSDVFAVFSAPHDVGLGVARRFAGQAHVRRFQDDHIGARLSIYDAGGDWKNIRTNWLSDTGKLPIYLSIYSRDVFVTPFVKYF